MTNKPALVKTDKEPTTFVDNFVLTYEEHIGTEGHKLHLYLNHSILPITIMHSYRLDGKTKPVDYFHKMYRMLVLVYEYNKPVKAHLDRFDRYNYTGCYDKKKKMWFVTDINNKRVYENDPDVREKLPRYK